MGQQTDDNKSVYIRENLSYYIIHYNNLGVIKPLGIKNNQSIRNERQIIAIIMKIFAKESMARQYKTDGVSYDVGFCFIVYKLVMEVAENRHIYYDEEKHKIRQKLIANLGFNFIRISPDVERFDLDVEIAKIYNYINKSSVRLPVNLAENL